VRHVTAISIWEYNLQGRVVEALTLDEKYLYERGIAGNQSTSKAIMGYTS
jgi:hypothetical protein